MTAEELFRLTFKKANDFGIVAKNDSRTIIDPKGNAVIRKNLSTGAFTEGDAFFGFLSSGEDTSGQYSDFSFVVFPDNENNISAVVVALGVGSAGFKDDYLLASRPGFRRDFLRLRDGSSTFFKTAFDDITSDSKDLLVEVKTNYDSLKTVINTYKKVLPASRIIDYDETNPDLFFNVLFQWLAMYAHIREWGTASQKELIQDVLNTIPSEKNPDDKDEIQRLLTSRKFVVVQGAPGTGKTLTALQIADNAFFGMSEFVQFHAETTYSDFVYGIEPNLNSKVGESQFKGKPGTLYVAIKKALDNPTKNVLLIIDEINRANLSNVLGPVFYLFEYQRDKGLHAIDVSIGDMKISQLPDNLYVLATMNTADRSLAVVDFALRRRFAWYTIKPHQVKPLSSDDVFMKKQYDALASIFYKYASDDELNLQPGPSYFIVPKANKDEKMQERLVYELMPLIKEYLAEGYLQKSKDSFAAFFLKETGKLMYE